MTMEFWAVFTMQNYRSLHDSQMDIARTKTQELIISNDRSGKKLFRNKNASKKNLSIQKAGPIQFYLL